MLEPVPDGEEPPAADAGRTRWCWWASAGPRSSWTGRRRSWRCGSARPAVAARATGAARDEHLGARARLREGAGLPGAWTVLLEPSTEGRAAASLARDGEGPCALYLRPAAGLDAWLDAARERGVTVERAPEGPFGAQVLLAAGPAGPHVIVTEGRSPVSGRAPAGTIAP